MKSVLYTILILLFSISALAQEDLDKIISRINNQIDNQQLPLKKITKTELLEWFGDYLPFQMIKEKREPFQKHLADNKLPKPYSIEIETRDDHPISGLKPLIVLKAKNLSMPIVRGYELRLYTTFARESCLNERTCKETFKGNIPTKGLALPPGTGVQVSESKASGICLVGKNCIPDILEVKILVTRENLNDLANYFGQGFDSSKIKTHLEGLLGADEKKQILLQDFLHGWLFTKANTFPIEGDNEVCHGPARQFFSSELLNGSQDRSTEPVAILLKDYYCTISDTMDPTFGDYLYMPGRHSGRFILKDPVSSRWIVFSVQSGGASAYRFWWADEDFSGRPFAGIPLPNFRERFVDVWRRCH